MIMPSERTIPESEFTVEELYVAALQCIADLQSELQSATKALYFKTEELVRAQEDRKLWHNAGYNAAVIVCEANHKAQIAELKRALEYVTDKRGNAAHLMREVAAKALRAARLSAASEVKP